MKTWTKMMTVAAIAIASVNAGTYMSRANAVVPFDFQVAGRPMPAGKYSVGRTANGAYIIENVQTGRAALFQAPLRTTAKPAAAGRLDFRCAAEACEIESVTFGGDASTYKRAFPATQRNHVAPTAASVRLGQD